jgi:hypothetical protein
MTCDCWWWWRTDVIHQVTNYAWAVEREKYAIYVWKRETYW